MAMTGICRKRAIFAIGQGFNLVTPLQAAMVMGEIAADGKRYQPYLVQRIVAPDSRHRQAV